LQEKWEIMKNAIEWERILNIDFNAIDEIEAIMNKN
jgi:hypothetical protein